MKNKFVFRGVQLDLARQMETINFIKKFINFAADNGYNSLFLYLEGRIRTKSFPYPEDSECYTPKEMKEVVKHATKKGINVFPGISLHGHAESFLKYRELESCAELRGKQQGRFWSDTKCDFCPSQEDTYIFFEKYLTEICDIFPSEYFHIGCDEVYDVGYCEKCASRAKDFRGEQQIFLDNLKRCHAILSGKLNKRVMIWDDMFELYRDILAEVPKDIILVCWQYRDDVCYINGHFSNMRVEHWLDEYERLGFEYIIAPSDFSSANVRTFTEYASTRKALGGLLTSWEKKTCFLYKSFPTMAYAGRLWDSDENKTEEKIFREAIKYLFGNCDELLAGATRFFTECRLSNESSISLINMLSLSTFGQNYKNCESMRLLKTVLSNAIGKIKTELGRIICKDMYEACEYNILKFRMKKAALYIVDFTDLQSSIEKIKFLESDMEVFNLKRMRTWEKCRSGIDSSFFKKHLENNLILLKSLPQKRKKHGIMKVRFCLPDKYSSQHCHIMIKYGQEWKEAAVGVFKNLDNEDSFYDNIFFTEKNMLPEAVRFESKGYGGQGLAYIQIINDTGNFVPVSVIKTKGKVVDSEYVLDNDCKWCFVGEKDTLKVYRNRDLAVNVHYIELKLKKQISS